MMQFEKVFRKKVYQLTNINIKETPLTLQDETTLISQLLFLQKHCFLIY